MAQMYSLIDTNTMSVLRQKPLTKVPDFTGHATKGHLKWVPYTHNNAGDYNTETHVREADEIIISELEHTVTEIIRPLTQQELEQRDTDLKDAEMDKLVNRSMLRLVFDTLFQLHNRVRVLEGQPTHTKAQVIASLRSRLDDL